MPSQGTQNRGLRQKINLLPQNEAIVGFAFAQPFCFGIGGKTTGRSRTTADIQFYVHSNFTRKGIGRCLLDRLVQCMSFAYGAKDGYSWMDFGSDDQVYKRDGTHYFHQLLIQLPMKAKDANVEWLTAFLKKYWFLPDVKISRAGRTAADSNQSEFLDTTLFCYEAMVVSDFPFDA